MNNDFWGMCKHFKAFKVVGGRRETCIIQDSGTFAEVQKKRKKVSSSLSKVLQTPIHCVSANHEHLVHRVRLRRLRISFFGF